MTNTEKNDEKLMELMGEVMDLTATAGELEGDLRTAQSCETIEDFRANLENALEHAKSLQKDIAALLRQAK